MSILFGAYLTTFLFNSARDSLLVVAIFHGMVDIVSVSRAATDITLIVVNVGLIAAAVLVIVKYAPQQHAPARLLPARHPHRSRVAVQALGALDLPGDRQPHVFTERHRPDLPDRSRHRHHALRHATIERLQLDPAFGRDPRTLLMPRALAWW